MQRPLVYHLRTSIIVIEEVEVAEVGTVEVTTEEAEVGTSLEEKGSNLEKEDTSQEAEVDTHNRTTTTITKVK